MSSHRSSHQQLLHKVKATAGELLSTGMQNVWQIPGALPRLQQQIHAIFQHRLKELTYWPFLQQTLTPSELYQLELYADEVEKGNAWMKHALHTFTISKELERLFSYQHLISKLYHEDAFVRQPEFVLALLTCLRAIEINDISMLAHINPNLLTFRSNSYNGMFGGNRADSIGHATDTTGSRTDRPGSLTDIGHRIDNVGYQTDNNTPRTESVGHRTESLATRSDSFGYRVDSIGHRTESIRSGTDSGQESGVPVDGSVAASDVASTRRFSLPDNCSDGLPKMPAITSNSQNEGHSSPAKTLKHGSSHSISIDEQEDKMPATNITTTATPKHRHMRSVSADFAAKGSPSIARTFSEAPPSLSSSVPSGGGALLFPRPEQGQSLRSYLQSRDFQTCASMDRENAHFSISEALIAAIEQMKCNQIIGSAKDDAYSSDDDDEIRDLKKKIQVRRHQKMCEDGQGFPAPPPTLLSDGRTETTTSGTNNSCDSSSHHTDENSCIAVPVQTPTEIAITPSGFDANSSGTHSDFSFLSTPFGGFSPGASPNSSLDQSSFVAPPLSNADMVAISLLQRFQEEQLPAASDLDWLVSEEQVPQALLPLPKSWPVSPDDAESTLHLTRLRGNLDWAPPRFQIVFNIPLLQSRKIVMAKQNYRCCGCGMTTQPNFAKRFRYCHYLGKYFCSCCHGNHTAIIPARILHKWDFGMYPVSNFSRDLLAKIHQDPLFDVRDVNATLYRKVKVLETVRNIRKQLFFVKDFILTCKFASADTSSVKQEFEKVPKYMITEFDLYSISNFVSLKTNQHLFLTLKNSLEACLHHVFDCPLCAVKGFVCELCNNDQDIIFPFQLEKSVQCSTCHSCFHQTCFASNSQCPKCLRIQLRRSKSAQE